MALSPALDTSVVRPTAGAQKLRPVKPNARRSRSEIFGIQNGILG